VRRGPGRSSPCRGPGEAARPGGVPLARATGLAVADTLADAPADSGAPATDPGRSRARAAASARGV